MIFKIVFVSMFDINIINVNFTDTILVPKVSRETLTVQDMVCCDNNRVLVIFRGSDIYRFVGASKLLIGIWKYHIF